jgi:hypothetical protein
MIGIKQKNLTLILRSRLSKKQSVYLPLGHFLLPITYSLFLILSFFF